jgi:type IV pilus assembly protein PilX
MQSERGFVLVTSLIFLVVLTLLAVTAINSSTLQERMASNLRASSHARQNADAGLRYAEYLLHQSAFDNYKPAGACYPNSIQPDENGCTQTQGALRIWGENKMFGPSVKDYSLAFLDSSVWNNTAIQIYRAETDPYIKPVQFFVEDLKSQFKARDLNPDTAAQAEGATFYRITARAHGADPAAIAVTQSIYEKHY